MHATGFDSFGIPLDETLSYRDLRATGLSRRGLEAAIKEGILIRARRDVYLSAEAAPPVICAQRVGGRLDCVSALKEYGIFVLNHAGLHIQVEPNHSRLRSPHSRTRRLTSASKRGTVIHWRKIEAPTPVHTVPVLQAIAQSARCQQPRSTIATIDSALHHGHLAYDDLDELFAALPLRFAALRPLVDGRAEAGSETLARLMLKAFGRRVEVQVRIPGVGRVDLVVDGWLVVECDSRQFHEGWEAQARDRSRDLALAAQGYVCIRPTAKLIFETPEVLLDAVRGLLAAHRGN